MTPSATKRRAPVLDGFRRVGRLTCVEIRKLVSHKLFPATLIITVLVTLALGIATKAFTEGMRARFTNYSLWVAAAGYGLQVGTILLVALGAMAMSMEATGRTLNTVLARPIRRIEFAVAKALSLLFAAVAVVLAAGLSGFIIGGTVPVDPPRSAWRGDIELSEPSPLPSYEDLTDPDYRRSTVRRPTEGRFPSYADVVDPDYGTVIATRGEVMGEILFGFLLLVVPVAAGIAVGFLIGTLVDSSGLAIGLSVGAYVTIEATKFVPVLHEYVGYLSFTYPLTHIPTIMTDPGLGKPAQWGGAINGLAVSAAYIAVSLIVSLVVFCRRDVTL